MDKLLLKQYKKSVANKLSNKEFLDILFDSYKALDSETRYCFFKHCLVNGIIEQHSMNYLSTKLLIEALKLEHFEDGHSSKYKFDKLFSAEKKNSYRCSIPSMYCDITFHCRLDKTTDYSWCFSHRSNTGSYGLNTVSTDKLLNPNDLVVLDLETTGLDPLTDDIIEIALYDIETGKSFSRLLPLIKSNQVSKKIENLTGISEDMLCKATPLSNKEFSTLIKEFKLDKKILFIWANNNMFDANFLAIYALDNKLDHFDTLKFVSGIELVRETCANNHIGWLKKEYVANSLGIDCKNSHRALNDCIIESKIYKNIYDLSNFSIKHGNKKSNIYKGLIDIVKTNGNLFKNDAISIYNDFISVLKEEHGPVDNDYDSKPKTRGSEWIDIHHIYETHLDNIGTKTQEAIKNNDYKTLAELKEYNKKENLVYATKLEHFILHFLIEFIRDGLGAGPHWIFGCLLRNHLRIKNRKIEKLFDESKYYDFISFEDIVLLYKFLLIKQNLSTNRVKEFWCISEQDFETTLQSYFDPL